MTRKENGLQQRKLPQTSNITKEEQHFIFQATP
jgi:hypothetical protein